MSNEQISIGPEDLEPEIKITEEDLEPEIKISEEDLEPEAQRPALQLPSTVVIEGEEVEVPLESIVIGWRDIIEAEAHSPAHVEGLDEQVSETVTDKYHFSVLSNLRGDVGRMKDEGKSARDIFRELALRYHPDLYQDMDEKTQELAETYFKATGSLKENGELE